MKVKEFETAIASMGMTILEIRIKHSDVTMVKGMNKDFLIEWDRYGRAKMKSIPEGFDKDNFEKSWDGGMWHVYPPNDLFHGMELVAMTPDEICKEANIYDKIAIKAAHIVQRKIFRDILFIIGDTHDNTLKLRITKYMQDAGR